MILEPALETVVEELQPGTIVALTVAGTVVLAGTHLLADRFHRLVDPDRNPVHSGLAGFTTAYVFLTLLPDISHGSDGSWLGIVPEGRVALVLFGLSLGAFVLYYVLEIEAVRRSRGVGEGSDGGTDRGVYRLHLATFTAVNATVGFLLPHHMAEGLLLGLMYVLAAAVHFLVMDHGLASLHGGTYGRTARLLHGGGLTAGAGAALLLGPVPPTLLTDPLLALLAGAIILQVFREEIPRKKDGTAWAFALGALIYSALLTVILVATAA